MLNPPKYLIIAVYGLTNVFDSEPVYLIFRESDGIVISYAYNYQEASSNIVSLLKNSGDIPSDILSEQSINKHIEKILVITLSAYAKYMEETGKVELISYYFPEEEKQTISTFLINFIEKHKLNNILPRKGVDNTPL